VRVDADSAGREQRLSLTRSWGAARDLRGTGTGMPRCEWSTRAQNLLPVASLWQFDINGGLGPLVVASAMRLGESAAKTP
jgi:hypothetical protein